MRTYLLTFLSILFVSNAIAQRTTTLSKNKKPKEYIYPSNVVKINLTSFLFKTFAVQYERKVAPKLSIALGAIYRPGSSLFMYNMLSQNAGNYNISPENAYSYGTAKLRRLAFTPEVKYYFKRKTPKGLYLSGFFRYQSDNTTFNYKYNESNTTPSVEKIGLASIKENAYGGGILFGYQIVSKKKLAIDFWFLGPWLGINKTNFSSKINMSNINQFDKAIISSNLEPMAGNNALIWQNDGFNTNLSSYKLGIRTFGINIGYNF
jgi:hypothetical protein